jgi:urease accessory protein
MSAAISLSEPRLANTAHGAGQVIYGVDANGVTRLRDLYQSDPVRVLFPTPPRGEIPAAAFVTTSGGLVGGDVLELTAQADEDAAVLCYPQAAEKIYRSTGATCQIMVSLRAASGAWLEWLPQETIMFDGARLIRRTVAEITPGGRLLAGEMTVLGRAAMGETLCHGLLRDDWSVRRDGRLLWADSFCLDGDIADIVAHPAGLAGASALATAVYVADDAGEFLATARDLLDTAPASVRVGATLVNDILVVRFMAADSQSLRHAFGEFWAGFRQAAAGLPAALPRLWHI